MRERWSKCRDTIGSDSELRARWDSLTDKEKARYKGDNNSERYRKFVNAETFKEVETRDWRWLYTGEEPKLSFETDALEAEIKRKRPQELKTANILRKNGIDTEFVVDSVQRIDPNTGIVKRVGLADFANGYEIKTLENASSYNTINGYLKNTSRKENAKYVCFDNSKGAMSNGLLVECLNRSRTFRRGRVYIIDSAGKYRYIR